MVKNDSLLPEGNCPERFVSWARWDQEIGLDLCPESHKANSEGCHRAAGESCGSVGRPGLAGKSCNGDGEEGAGGGCVSRGSRGALGFEETTRRSENKG